MKNKKTGLKFVLYFFTFTIILFIVFFISFYLPSQQNRFEILKPQILGTTQSLIRGENLKNNHIVKVSNPDLTQINAKSYLVFDLDTEQILAEKNKNQKLPIASLTKLLTGLVTYQNVDLGSTVTIDQNDTLNFEPKLNLMVGDQIKVIDLFNAMIIGSSNDAALTLSNFVTKETKRNFIDLMNEAAKTLKMNNSHFNNPVGFDSKQNFSTAEDLSLLVKATQSLAAFNNLGKKTEYKFTSLQNHFYQISSTNNLLNSNPDIEAVKTGFTDKALGSMICKVVSKNRKIIFIILASNNREKDMLMLKDEIMKSYNF